MPISAYHTYKMCLKQTATQEHDDSTEWQSNYYSQLTRAEVLKNYSAANVQLHHGRNSGQCKGLQKVCSAIKVLAEGTTQSHTYKIACIEMTSQHRLSYIGLALRQKIGPRAGIRQSARHAESSANSRGTS